MGSSELIADWEGYYIASTGAAAVLLGLVFVGLSLHFERNPRKPGVRGLAIQAAASLLYALLVSLVMLVPEGRPTSQALILIVVALFGIWTSMVAFVDARGDDIGAISLTFRFGLPLVMMTVLLGAAVALLVEWRPGVWLIGAVVFLHIVVGTQNAWDLFLGAGATESTTDSNSPP